MLDMLNAIRFRQGQKGWHGVIPLPAVNTMTVGTPTGFRPKVLAQGRLLSEGEFKVVETLSDDLSLHPLKPCMLRV